MQTRNGKRQYNTARLGDLICHDDILEIILKLVDSQDGVNLIMTSKELYNLDMASPGPNKVVAKWLWELGEERMKPIRMKLAKRGMLSIEHLDKVKRAMPSFHKAQSAMRWVYPQTTLLLDAPSNHGGSANANGTDLFYNMPHLFV
jgi:hypothetical protein